MKITEIDIHFVKPNRGLVGFASFVLDGNIYFNSIAIYKKLNADGYRLLYPTKSNGVNIFHPINKETTRKIEAAIFNELDSLLDEDVSYN